MGALAGGCGTLGDLVMRALKKDAGVRFWGNRSSVTGAVGLLDRVAPLCLRRRCSSTPCAGTSDAHPRHATTPACNAEPACNGHAHRPRPATTGFGLIRRASAELRGQRHHQHAGSAARGPAAAAEDHLRRRAGSGAALPAACASVEIVFVNVNPQSTLLLGQARGAALAALVSSGLPVAEYTALQMKKAIVGHGLANKDAGGRRWSSGCWRCPACPARTRPTRWGWPSRTPTPVPRSRRWRRPRPLTRRQHAQYRKGRTY
jgi:crossover junction endodeoxyribonuclease RuvC